jgi:hypothetical protein
MTYRTGPVSWVKTHTALVNTPAPAIFCYEIVYCKRFAHRREEDVKETARPKATELLECDIAVHN